MNEVPTRNRKDTANLNILVDKADPRKRRGTIIDMDLSSLDTRDGDDIDSMLTKMVQDSRESKAVPKFNQSSSESDSYSNSDEELNAPVKKPNHPNHPTQQSHYQTNPKPAQPYQPTPSTAQYQPSPSTAKPQQPSQSQYQPNQYQGTSSVAKPSQSSYQPQPSQSSYQPQPSQSSYQPQPSQSSYQPQPSQSQHQTKKAVAAAYFDDEPETPMPSQQTQNENPKPATVAPNNNNRPGPSIPPRRTGVPAGADAVLREAANQSNQKIIYLEGSTKLTQPILQLLTKAPDQWQETSEPNVLINLKNQSVQEVSRTLTRQLHACNINRLKFVQGVEKFKKFEEVQLWAMN
eukprot:TRINITY_DN3968_c0_g1_i2.p1 TRINITY_DN3968_c0_g1~~TRINITY_DN3968_c0_g1_i2.p1  ORF type:complete len:391 (-),score=111.19 TRINITY_DN3968_c0_g1_i2:28-1071(-)